MHWRNELTYVMIMMRSQISLSHRQWSVYEMPLYVHYNETNMLHVITVPLRFSFSLNYWPALAFLQQRALPWVPLALVESLRRILQATPVVVSVLLSALQILVAMSVHEKLLQKYLPLYLRKLGTMKLVLLDCIRTRLPCDGNQLLLKRIFTKSINNFICFFFRNIQAMLGNTVTSIQLKYTNYIHCPFWRWCTDNAHEK